MEFHRHLLFLIILSLSAAQALRASSSDCSCQTTSHTFFTVRPQFQVASPELLSLWRGKQRLQEGECHSGGFQAVLFGGRSTKPNKLGTYFMPFCSPKASVTSTVAPGSTSLFAQNFNIPSIQFGSTVVTNLVGIPPLANPFSSTIEVQPRQAVIGLGLTYQHNFRFNCMEYWARLIAPIINVRNNMHLKEKVLTSGVYTIPPIPGTNLADPQPNMQAALSQEQWLYGKIDNKTHKKTRLAFIEAQLGAVVIDNDCYYLSPYVGVNIPTGNTPNGKFVFEPIAGNGNHFGIFWGFDAELFAWANACDTIEIGAAIDVNWEYLFKKTHRRSIDLKNRPWTRYIETYASLDQAIQAVGLFGTLQGVFLNTPGINTLTQKVSVKPGFNFTANFAVTFMQPCDCGFEGELGYNFYAKQSECVSLKDRFDTTVAIKDHIGGGFVNPVRDITENQTLNEATAMNLLVTGGGIVDRYNGGIIKQSDLNLASASHPCALSHTVYGTAGYHWNNWCHPIRASLGLSYEFSGKQNTALNRWLAWGSVGIFF